jgi:hypothetical protein
MKSGLSDIANHIHIGVTGSQEIENPFSNSVVAKNNPDLWEGPTLMALNDFANNSSPHSILYFHTKGITHPSKNIKDWRNMMEYFCIERWRDCLRGLEEFDTVGCNFSDETLDGSNPHYSGNFWWARSEYIKTCDKKWLNTGNRVDQECWIGTGRGSMLNAYSPDVDLKFLEHPRYLYEDIAF